MKTVNAGGVRLATVDEGRGVPLVLVHGFPLDHSMWRNQIDYFSRHCRVIAPDLRGFGSSDATPGTVNIAEMADDVAGLLDALEVKEPVVLGGLSMGGYVAFQFWRRHARRLRGLVLCDTRAMADTAEAAAQRYQTAERVLREGPAFLAETMLSKLLAPITLNSRPDVAAEIRRSIESANAEGVAAASRGMADRPDVTPWLGEIEIPTLIVVGKHDAISPVEEMGRIAAAISGARLVEIADAGHMSPLENPAAVNRAMDEFLKIRQPPTG